MADNGGTHTTMPRSLAKALIDAGMQHHSFGGDIGGFIGNILPAIGGAAKSVGQAFTAENGFEAANPDITRQQLQPQIQQVYGQNQDVYGQQQSLAQTLLAQSQGQGPNVAQAQLNQATGQNVAQQGALMASQRGASANPALIAALAARQGAGVQQQAVGQAATLQAQQQLAAQQALQSQQAQMANQALQQQQLLQQAQAAQNSAITTGQLGAQQLNAGIKGQNIANQNATTAGFLSALGGASSLLPKSGGGGAGTAMAGEPSSLAAFTAAHGGQIPNYDMGGFAAPQDPHLGLNIQPGQNAFQGINDLETAAKKNAPLAAAALNSGGWSPMLAGGKVGGKAKVKGDSEENDNQKALLSPGEVVLPRSVAMAEDAPDRAAEFVRHLMKDKKMNKGYGGVIDAKKSLKERVEHLEKLCSGGMA